MRRAASQGPGGALISRGKRVAGDARSDADREQIKVNGITTKHAELQNAIACCTALIPDEDSY
jgi:hypothetical protein